MPANMEPEQTEDDYTPSWLEKSSKNPAKPQWQDKIPHELWELGRVFFPIPSGKKAWRYAHHKHRKRFYADDEVLNGYFAQGWGYGIACAENLAVVDIDEPDEIERLTSYLPETMYQWSGSREGVHLFYIVEGLNTRVNLALQSYTDTHKAAEGYNLKTDDELHVGEVKCDPHGYVVGPGSLHPSGNHYGPLKGDEIAEVDKSQFLYALREYKRSEITREDNQNYNYEKRDYTSNKTVKTSTSQHPLFELSADDVVPWLESGKRVSHPVHGSSSNSNFMRVEGDDYFMCWRCQHGSTPGCSISPLQFLAIEQLGNEGNAGDYICQGIKEQWGNNEILYYKAWKRAVELELITPENPPYKVMIGYAKQRGLASSREEVSGETYYTVRNAMEYERAEKNRPEDN